MTVSKPTDYVSTPLIEIKGADTQLLNDFKRDILQISIEESLHLSGMFTLVINNPYLPVNEDTKTWKYESLIQMGKIVKLGFISSTTSESKSTNKAYLIEGEITGIETHFTSRTQAPIIIRGYDVAHRLHRGRYIRSFQDMTDTDIVKKLVEEVGIKTETIDPSGEKHPYVFQENQTNMEFLRERAARTGFELFVQDGKLSFRNPQASEVLKLQWLRDISSFRVRVTTAEQVKSVEVRGWDYERKEPIIARIPDPNKTPASDKANSQGQIAGQINNRPMNQVLTGTEYGKGRDYSHKFGSNLPEPKLTVVDKPIATVKEAEIMATALFNELEGEFVCADAEAPGDPRIRPGKIIELAGMGRYTGKYYITETRHLYYQGIYTTEFSVRGLRGGDLLQTLCPTTRLRPGQTHLVGIVTDNQDPNSWGRVKVKFPTLSPEQDSTAHSSQWARVVSIGAGAGRGFDCLPEINDEVLVAFEHGDIHRPYIIGSVWNGKDKPPTTVKDAVADSGVDKGKVRLRTFKTRTGHVLKFVESDEGVSHAGVYIQTSKGHKINLDDSTGSIAITTKGGQSIHLDDPGNISIQSGGSINLQPASGTVNVSGIVLCGGIFLNPLGALSGAVNVGQTLTNLQQQLDKNTSDGRQRPQEISQTQPQLQQNILDNRQRQQQISQRQQQLQNNPETNQFQNSAGSGSQQTTSPPKP